MDEMRFENPADARSNDYQSWLLIELQRRLHSLPPGTVEETVQEVREHLACSQAALIELGESPRNSDLEAVRRFGDVKAFAAHVIRSYRSDPFVCPWLPRLTLAATLYIMGLAIFTVYDMPAYWCGAGITLAFFVALSWRARDFQWRGLVKAGLLATVIVSATLGLTWVSLRRAGGIGEVPRWSVNFYKGKHQLQLSTSDKGLFECDRASALYTAGRAAVEASDLYRAGTYTAFHVEQVQGWMVPRYMPRTTNSFDAASQTWATYRAHGRYDWQANRDWVSHNLAALETAPATPFDTQTALEGAAAAGVLSSAAILLNFMISVLRGIYDRVRNRPRRLFA